MDSTIIYNDDKHPFLQLTYDRKLRVKILKSYFESKLNCLSDPKLSPRLALLACWDARVEPEDLTTERGRKKFIKKSIKYYKQQIKNIEKLERKL